MTPEQERAEVRIDKTKIVAWLKRMIEGNEFAEADGESSAYKFTLGRIEDGKFDSSSLDREEQLLQQYEKYSEALKGAKTTNLELAREVAERDKEIQRLRELLDIEIKAHSKTADKYHRAINKLENHFYQS